ncbi:hypothetical protein [Ruegeria sp.]|uniref:hypothetical protein n=1 Tax=Ruegeria sp. TaxID=1879320 RepID=UPI003B006637
MRNLDDSADIAKVHHWALATLGGHLTVGRGGFSLHYLNASLSGYECETVKVQAIAAGLPVIDSCCVKFDRVMKLAISGPMIAVGRTPDPEPRHAFSCAPLIVVAQSCATAGAEVCNPDLNQSVA